MGENLTKSVEYAGAIYLVGMATSAVITWFAAFQTNNKAILVTINNYGEAWPELTIHIIGILCVIYLVWVLFYRKHKGGDQ